MFGLQRIKKTEKNKCAREVAAAVVLKEPKTTICDTMWWSVLPPHGDHHLQWINYNVVKKIHAALILFIVQFDVSCSSERSSQNTHLSVPVDFFESWMHADLCHQWQRSAALWFFWSVLVRLLYSGTFSENQGSRISSWPGRVSSVMTRIIILTLLGFVWFMLSDVFELKKNWVRCANT